MTSRREDGTIHADVCGTQQIISLWRKSKACWKATLEERKKRNTSSKVPTASRENGGVSRTVVYLFTGRPNLFASMTNLPDPNHCLIVSYFQEGVLPGYVYSSMLMETDTDYTNTIKP